MRSLTRRAPTVSTRRIFACCLLGVALWLPGCALGTIPATYSPEEMAATCQRNGGVWRGFVGEGYCEYQSPGFL
jgi:hypothetical protein